MNRFRLKSLLAPVAAAALLAVLAGCGSDSSGQDSTVASSPTEISIQSPTSPIAVSTESTTTDDGGGGKKKPAQTTTSGSGGSGGSGGCIVPDAFQDFEYTGVPCTSAVIVAQAWDANGKTCNTIDNPNSPDGFNRTCTVEGFTCRAKRDVRSDARFVTCAQGGRSIRFTWLPA
jgi:hypothetical protein